LLDAGDVSGFISFLEGRCGVVDTLLVNITVALV
jgi:hypothetical protein